MRSWGVLRWALSTLGTIGVLLAFAGGLILQPGRWSNTPAYGNLVLILPARLWGVVYLGVALMLLVSKTLTRYRAAALGAHALAFVLMLTWAAAFIIRWRTDSGTTVANVVGWSVYTAMVVVSAKRVDNDHLVQSELA